MKFTSRDLINKFLENMNTQKGKRLDIAVSNIFYDADVFGAWNTFSKSLAHVYQGIAPLNLFVFRL